MRLDFDPMAHRLDRGVSCIFDFVARQLTGADLSRLETVSDAVVTARLANT